MRFFIELSYNGKHYHGWQVQPNANTVQKLCLWKKLCWQKQAHTFFMSIREVDNSKAQTATIIMANVVTDKR